MTGPAKAKGPASFMEVAGQRYGLHEATVLFAPDGAVDIYAVGRGGGDKPGPSLSLNGVPVRGVRAANELAGKAVEFPPPAVFLPGTGTGTDGEDDDDGCCGEQGEHVVVTPREILEIGRVDVKFGRFAGGFLDIDLDGTVGVGAPFKAHLVARLVAAVDE